MREKDFQRPYGQGTVPAQGKAGRPGRRPRDELGQEEDGAETHPAA